MKISFILFCVFVIGVAAYVEDEHSPIMQAEMIKKVNHNLNVHWLAGINSRFEGMSKSAVMKMLGAELDKKMPADRIVITGRNDIPDAFDSRTEWPGCVHPVLDQGQCGSCWAFGAAESLSDRFCIKSQKAKDFELSPQDLVSCDWEGNQGCGGGIPHLAWDYMEVMGIRTLNCVPYTSGTGDRGTCAHKCHNETASDTHYKAKLLSTKGHYGVKSIATAIMEDGPVEGTFTVYEDFMHYKSGVYEHTEGGFLGGHAIEMVGWGKDSASGKAYWIIKNSWNTSWGIDGYFWILKGKDECGIESGAVAGQPAL